MQLIIASSEKIISFIRLSKLTENILRLPEQ